MREYTCDHCGSVKEYEAEEVGNKMYVDCSECGVKVGMRFTGGKYASTNIRKYGNDTTPSKWEQIRNRPQGGDF